MDRIKRLSYEVLDTHKPKFGEDFADNKKALDQVAIIRSKGLKNEIAGYITKFIKKEIREAKFKESQILESQAEEQLDPEIEAKVDVSEDGLESSPTPEESTTLETIETTSNTESVTESPTPEESTTPETIETPTSNTESVTESTTPKEQSTEPATVETPADKPSQSTENQGQ